ncbi:MAG: phosphatase PAP2 family protein [Limnobacter sp.]|nr:phosphatase PAP2 family protein [Limnobacter sp.]
MQNSFQQTPSFSRLYVLPTLLACLLFYLFYVQHLDFAVAHWLYALEGQQWALTNHWWFKGVMHDDLRRVNNAALLALCGFWLITLVRETAASPRFKALSRLLVSLVLSYAIVAIVKRLLPAECPWDLLQFGGNKFFVSVFEHRPSGWHATQCFPAGHAGIGFAWLALYYYWADMCPARAKWGAWIGFVLGVVLGLGQQIRGAHFVSHDVTTAWICWSVATLVYFVGVNRAARFDASCMSNRGEQQPLWQK